jgi:iron complex transport system ATP-binding protein
VLNGYSWSERIWEIYLDEYWGMTPGMEVVLSGFFSSVELYDHQAISHFQRAQSYTMMERLGVGLLSEKPFAQMSTGEQRRMLLARALVHEPSTLLLDEPTSGLDVSACFQYLEILRQFIREGGTVILVTHHIHEIPPEIDRVVLLKDGRIQDDGPKEEVLNEHSLSALFGAIARAGFRSFRQRSCNARLFHSSLRIHLYA